MENTQLEVKIKEKILNNIEDAMQNIESQTLRFQNLLINKITRTFNFKSEDVQRIKQLFVKTFLTNVVNELDTMIDYYKSSEIDFYSKNMKTADLIFNTLNDKRTQIIYLENLMKKIKQKETNNINLFDEPINNLEENMGIKDMFEQFVGVIANNPHLSMDDADDLRTISNHYYSLYINDISLTLKKIEDDNKDIANSKIEEEMDKRKLRNGKTSTISKLERTITNNSLKAIEELLTKTVSKYKSNAEIELNTYQTSIVELFFKVLSVNFQEQKDLIEIIVDTNIDRLNKLLNNETNKLYDNLHEKNQDIIENELYEEKRYKKINNYESDTELIDKVYLDIMNEIKLAYDISENDRKFKKLKLVVISESNSTKVIFKNLIDYIIEENQENLKLVIKEMHKLSEKAIVEEQKNELNHILRKK